MKKIMHNRALWVLLMIFMLLCGTAYALMFRQTKLIENQFETAIVNCEVHEVLDGSGEYIQGEQTTDSKKSITIKNTGNIDAYIRVKFISYWVDENGDIIAKASQMPTIRSASDWIAGSDNTYYYKKAVNPGAFTGEFLQEPMTLLISDEGYYQVVEVFADAIQSIPETAAGESWNVTIENSEIISAEN